MLLGVLAFPVAGINSLHVKTTINVTSYGGVSVERQLSRENIHELLSLLVTLKEAPHEYHTYLPLLLEKLEDFELIDDALNTEEMIVNTLTHLQYDEISSSFLNVFCFMVGNGTNSVILPPSSLLFIGCCRLMLEIIQFFPILYNLIWEMIIIPVVYTLFYLPQVSFPCGIWGISGDAELSTVGLLGKKETTIHGGKFGKYYLIAGFKGLWLTFPSEAGDIRYPQNWFIGSAITILEIEES